MDEVFEFGLVLAGRWTAIVRYGPCEKFQG